MTAPVYVVRIVREDRYDTVTRFVGPYALEEAADRRAATEAEAGAETYVETVTP